MDVSEPSFQIKTGSYYLLPSDMDSVAKIDASTPKVRLVLVAQGEVAALQRRTRWTLGRSPCNMSPQRKGGESDDRKKDFMP